jgi:hypothetical protein
MVRLVENVFKRRSYGDGPARAEPPDPSDEGAKAEGTARSQQAVIEDMIRELEWEDRERWQPLIERLRGAL